jgi:hypothetical protein
LDEAVTSHLYQNIRLFAVAGVNFVMDAVRRRRSLRVTPIRNIVRA